MFDPGEEPVLDSTAWALIVLTALVGIGTIACILIDPLDLMGRDRKGVQCERSR